MKSISLFIFLSIIPYYGFGQMSFDEIKGKAIEIKERYINKEILLKEAGTYRGKFYGTELNGGGIVDTSASTIITLVYLYAELNELDSAFYFLEIFTKSYGCTQVVRFREPIVRLFDDPRFAKYLDECYSGALTKNNKGQMVLRNTTLDKLILKIEYLEQFINSINYLTQDYYLPLRKESSALEGELRAYKTRKFQEFVKSEGFPKYSTHGSSATDRLIVHLLQYSINTLFDHIDELEQLALEKEIDGSKIAPLVDENLLSLGQKQRYGTIYVTLPNLRKVVPLPIESVEEVNLVRKEIGLDFTLEEYIQGVENFQVRF